jgi:hypothetical protein
MRRHALFPIVFLLGSACDGGGPSPEEAFVRLSQTACARQIDCGVIVVSPDTTLDGCVATNDQAIATIAGTHLQFDGDAIARCEAAVTSATCQTLANQRMIGLAECTRLIRGSLSQGAACMTSAAGDPCGDGLGCHPDDDGTPCGTCRPQPDDCIEGGCPEGDYCDENHRCVPQHRLGESCQLFAIINEEVLWERTCVHGTYCDFGPDPGAPAVCQPEPAPGATCSPDVVPYACTDGSSCVLGTCVPAVALGAVCDDFAECSPGLTCAARTCVARLAQGEACSATVYGACGPGLSCQLGSCAPIPKEAPPVDVSLPILEAGAPCDQAPGICPLGTACLCEDRTTCPTLACVAGPKLGESCEAQGETAFNPYACSEGYCDILVFAEHTCVKPALAGAPCDYAEPTATFECVNLVCANHVCQGIDDSVCR